MKQIYKDVIERYIKMGANQFLRDFRRDFQIKKSTAHRKAVMQIKKGESSPQANESQPVRDQTR